MQLIHISILLYNNLSPPGNMLKFANQNLIIENINKLYCIYFFQYLYFRGILYQWLIILSTKMEKLFFSKEKTTGSNSSYIIANFFFNQLIRQKSVLITAPSSFHTGWTGGGKRASTKVLFENLCVTAVYIFITVKISVAGIAASTGVKKPAPAKIPFEL